MKKINKIYTFLAVALGLASCSNEAPFSADYPEGSGRVLTSSLEVQVKTENPKVRADQNGIPAPADFKVEFFNKENETKAEKTYESYGKMPEIVVLPAGEYKIVVSYGEDYDEYGNNAAFNKPHYEGSSDYFTVEKDKIIDNLDPIIGRLVNVRVAVKFDASLKDKMSPDSKVSVKVGDSGNSLNFDVNTTQDGYFEYAEGSNTLAATFTGKVEDVEVIETKTFDDVKKGNYYVITFRLHSADASGNGNIDPDHDDSDFVVDASVSYVVNNDTDLNDATPDDEQDLYLEDDMRPENGEDPNAGDQPGTEEPGTDPENPDDPKNPDNPGVDIPDDNIPGPQITANEGVNLDEVNDVAGLTECKLLIHAEGGIKTFTVTIDSPALVADLEDMAQWEDGSNLDLIYPDYKKDFLENLLGREVGESLIGVEDMEFDITQFLVMMDSFKGIHKFIVNVSDLNGKSSSATLQLEIK